MSLQTHVKKHTNKSNLGQTVLLVTVRQWLIVTVFVQMNGEFSCVLLYVQRNHRAY